MYPYPARYLRCSGASSSGSWGQSHGHLLPPGSLVYISSPRVMSPRPDKPFSDVTLKPRSTSCAHNLVFRTRILSPPPLMPPRSIPAPFQSLRVLSPPPWSRSIQPPHFKATVLAFCLTHQNYPRQVGVRTERHGRARLGWDWGLDSRHTEGRQARGEHNEVWLYSTLHVHTLSTMEPVVPWVYPKTDKPTVTQPKGSCPSLFALDGGELRRF